MENLETVKELAQSLKNSVGELEAALQPFFGQPLEELVKHCKSPKEEAEYLNNYLYCTVSIIFAYLKTSGVNTDGHPIMKELDRVKASMKKVKEIDLKKEKAEEEEAKNKEQAAQYIQNTFGTGSGGAAAPSSLNGPAISTVHFQGTHTKFEDSDSDSDSDAGLQSQKIEEPSVASKIIAQSTAKLDSKKQTKPAKTPQGRVSKPKHNQKGNGKSNTNTKRLDQSKSSGKRSGKNTKK